MSWDCFRRGRWSKRPSTKAGRHQNGPIDQEAVAFRQVRKAFGLALPRGHQSKAQNHFSRNVMYPTLRSSYKSARPRSKPTTGLPLTGRLQLSELRVASRTMTLWPATRLGINSDQPIRRAARKPRTSSLTGHLIAMATLSRYKGVPFPPERHGPDRHPIPPMTPGGRGHSCPPTRNSRVRPTASRTPAAYRITCFA